MIIETHNYASLRNIQLGPMTKTIITVFCILFVSVTVHAQPVVKQTIIIPYNQDYRKNGKLIIIEPGFPVSSVAIRTGIPVTFSGASIVADADTFYLSRDEHIDNQFGTISNLVIFPKPVDLIGFNPGTLRDTLELYQIRADSANIDNGANGLSFLQNSEPKVKTMPAMIDQSVWRQGLRPPDYDRIVHEVHNLIIHHSATSNLVTDYTSAVRNIYIYHTRVNNWSDIGYNYIIAPNGAIYKGRDPGRYDQDKVMGAHFCSSNRGTMGICILGTYTDMAPTPAALSSLNTLLAWKAGKDKMDPFGTYFHPLNTRLGVIAGHRDGCATLCPGDGIYSGLQEIRNQVHSILLLTGTDGPGNSYGAEHNGSLAGFFPNPVSGTLWIRSAEKINRIIITDMYGRQILTREGDVAEIDLENLPSGCYVIDVRTEADRIRQKILKL